MSGEAAIRAAVVEAMRRLEASGLNQGTSGNVSARFGEGLLVTPSGIPSEALRPEDIVKLRMDGSSEGRLAPSSEWRFHRDILAARPEIGAVVHAHPPHATAFAICRRDIPAAHYMIAAAGGPTIRCARYATFGTQALSDAALEALRDRQACLLANHGMIAAGPSLARALWLAIEVETLCRQYALALRIGEPVLLPEDEIARVTEAFRGYGPREADPGGLPPGIPIADIARGEASS